MSNTIKNGNAITVPVQTGESLTLNTITGTYTATIVSGAGMGTVLATASDAGATYGPYAGPVVIEIRCSSDGLTDFEVGTSPTLDYELPVGAKIDPLTGGITLQAGGSDAAYAPPVGAKTSAYRMNPDALAVMASPPTVTTNTTNTLAAGQFFGAGNQSADANGAGNASISFFRGGYYRRVNSGYPNYLFVTADTLSQGSPNTYANIVLQYSFIHTGTRFSLFFKGTAPAFLVKVDGQFVSLTPISVANDGGLYYSLIDFAVLGTRRIDIIGYTLQFGGVYTDLTDTLYAAPRRGPRTIVLSDSFGEGSGNEVSPLFSWVTYMAEYLGWDDVIPSAVGATGLIEGTLPKVPFGTRAVRDVAGLNPAIVWVSQSVNDSGQSAAAVLAAAQSLVSTINAAGCYPKFVFSSPTITGGAGKIGQLVRDQQAAIKAWCLTAGHMYVDDIEMPIEAGYTPHSTTLSSSVAANATSVSTATALIAGSHYKFEDGTVCFARTSSTVDKVINAQASGATMTQCGPVYLTGLGRVGATVGWGAADACVSSDSTHPTNRGHQAKGYADANLFVRLQAPR